MKNVPIFVMSAAVTAILATGCGNSSAVPAKSFSFQGSSSVFRDTSSSSTYASTGGVVGRPEKVERAQAELLTEASFEDCNSTFPGFADHGVNYASSIDSGGVAHTGSCSAGIGLNGAEYGKLTTEPFTASKEVWFSGWVYFTPDFALPQMNIPYNGQNCSMGVHIWRLGDGVPAQKVAMDFNIPTALDTIQLLFFQLDGSGQVQQQFVKWTNFQPAAQPLRARWQYWQVHLNLGTPGKSDGFMRFYADNQFVDSLENQPFLPASADSSWAFTEADLQSNISDGGNTLCQGAWPSQNGWYVDDVRICSNGLC